MRQSVKENAYPAIAAYALCHAAVDFVCAFTVLGAVCRSAGAMTAAALVLLYNFIAFVMQPFIGFAADHFRFPRRFAAAGCILAGAAPFFAAFPVAATVLLGLGNAFFHVGGGVSVLRSSAKKATASGIYIAPGAIGLAAGIVFSKQNLLSPAAVFAIMAVCAACVLIFDGNNKADTRPVKRSAPAGFGFAGAALLLLFCAFIRSAVGFATPLAWKTTAFTAILAACAAALGKALGGILGDRIGYLPAAVAGLLCSAVLLPFFGGFLLPALIGLILFNFTMPIVLCALCDLFPDNPGFAFGLNSAALFPGVFFTGIAASPVMLAGITVFCAAALLAGLGLLYNFKIRRLKSA